MTKGKTAPSLQETVFTMKKQYYQTKIIIRIFIPGLKRCVRARISVKANKKMLQWNHCKMLHQTKKDLQTSERSSRQVVNDGLGLKA